MELSVSVGLRRRNEGLGHSEIDKHKIASWIDFHFEDIGKRMTRTSEA